MAQDIFGYENNVKTSGQVASSDFARVAIGAANALVQNVDVMYAQQIEEVAEVGSPQIHWMPGRPSGTVTIGALVGANGFFTDWKGKCGKINTASIMVMGGQCEFKGSGTLFFSGAVVQSFNANLSVGKQTIGQGAVIKTANMSTSN